MVRATSKNLLVIDDDQEVVGVITELIEERFRFNRTFVANTADEARKIIKYNEIHVVLSDYKLPDISGLQLFEKLHDKRIELPSYIFVTGYRTPELELQAKKLGAAIIEKPVGENLLKALRECV